uniref:DNA-directed RNA polymerase subunit n=1 Tax=Blastobotrys adeninivorans TaxID=409370 RepID=A0A060TCC8_BLAAD
MFFLSKISDLIRIDPESFGKSTERAVEDEIHARFANKVIHNAGLCVCLYDIESIGDGMVKHGDGASFVKVVFRMVMFRPFVGEILVGWVSSCTEEGLKVKMEFFNDIHIPKSLLFDNCVFIPTEQAWVWRIPNDDGTNTDLYIDTNEKIRFRVEQELFTEQHPKGPTLEDGEAAATQNQTPPYAIIGSCQADGMGLVSWW